MREYSALVGAVIYLVGSVPYIRDTMAGRVKPNKVTFALWALAPLISAAASFSEGIGWPTIPVLILGLVPALILGASFYDKGAYWKITAFDCICGAFSLAALILWLLTHQPNLAILFSIIADALAALPTIRKLWVHPQTEKASTYIASLICTLTSFLAARQFSFAALAFPTYWIIIVTIILYLLWRPRPAAKSSSTPP